VKRLSDITLKMTRLFEGLLPRREGAFAIGDIPLPMAVVTADLLGNGRSLFVCASPEIAEQAFADAMELLPKTTIHLLSSAEDETALLMGERTLQACAIQKAVGHSLIITSIHALLQPIPDVKSLEKLTLTLTLNEDHSFESLAQQLTLMGYERVELVFEPLTFAIRGGILDIWPIGSQQPTRLEFFGDTIDRMRVFDPISQCSVATIKSLVIPPTTAAKIRMFQLLPTLLDATVFIHDVPTIDATLEQLRPVSSRLSNKEWLRKHLDAFKHYVCWSGEPLVEGIPSVALAIDPFDMTLHIGDELPRNAHPEAYLRLRKQILTQLDERARKGEIVILSAESAAACELLSHDLPPETKIHLLQSNLSHGFTIRNLKLTVVTLRDLYPSKRKQNITQRQRKPLAGQRLEYAFDVEPGELVVHLEHGIGKFLGLSEINFSGSRSEVFTLEYADGVKLHVPTTHAHLLSRYIGPNGKKAKLHKLDSKRWHKERAAAQTAIEDLAAGLLETQARRRVLSGFAFDTQHEWIHEFEALFPWQETPDQHRAMAEIKSDMAAPIAMDRLLCGDAGYGKTELAMRAAFIAVCNHKQVVLLAPTTVLAEQHYATFCDRMAAFPVRIDVLSRFRTKTQRTATRLAAARGEVDILIGTHAILTENIPFHDLGLLIIDEEQRFGVIHKEQLKQLRALVDVLTMSATPIPRTLYLSLTGARDLSLIQTPPYNRLPVETIIHTDTDALLIKAIQDEISRGGQVYYLYNRVQTIGRVYQRLKELIPHARVLIGHGQMSSKELAQTMQAFERGEADVLLCTTIVESGIDIPRANTILIDRADRFGLADLYQLRGRVGRSGIKAFAYLLLPPNIVLDRESRQRLQALKRHSGLGAGYTIALRDLEIRGSGNLLGAAQSGHIAAIGFGLYCQLLRRTVARLKGDAMVGLIDTEMTLEFLNTSPGATTSNAAAIPYHYIEDEAQRMNLYRRMAEASTLGELRDLQSEIIDRYGTMPLPAKRTFVVAMLRIIAAERDIIKIHATLTHFSLYARLNHAVIPNFSNLPLPQDKTEDELLTWITQMVEKIPRCHKKSE
jgi:transcription-repair coupling factor (superfamily II helicase)